MTFEHRLLALLVLMAVVAGMERWRLGAAASRWREYSFVIAVACLGGAFGAAFDQVTCTLSPEYFVLGKGLETGPGFRWRVAQLGFQAGFGAGAITGCVLLVARGRRAVAYKRLFVAGLYTPGLAVFIAPGGGVAFLAIDPFGYVPTLSEFLSPDAIRNFLWVWGLHTGVYVGAMLGLMAGCWRVRRAASEPADVADVPPGEPCAEPAAP